MTHAEQLTQELAHVREQMRHYVAAVKAMRYEQELKTAHIPADVRMDEEVHVDQLTEKLFSKL
jgi:bacterioferritin (cytochrome b1)